MQAHVIQELRNGTPKNLGHLGFRVERLTKDLPQGADEALFRITGGKVLVTAVVGEVTEIIQTQANNTRLKFKPETGSDVDLCANLNITADVAKTLYVCTGTLADALVSTIGVALLQVTPWILDVGDIELDCTASNSGKVKWTLFYSPVEGGAIAAV